MGQLLHNSSNRELLPGRPRVGEEVERTGREGEAKKRECKNKTERPKEDKAQGRGAKPESKEIWDEKIITMGREWQHEDVERGRTRFMG